MAETKHAGLYSDIHAFRQSGDTKNRPWCAACVCAETEYSEFVPVVCVRLCQDYEYSELVPVVCVRLCQDYDYSDLAVVGSLPRLSHSRRLMQC